MIGSGLSLFAYLGVLCAFAVSLWMLTQRGKPAGLSTVERTINMIEAMLEAQQPRERHDAG